MSSFTTSGFNKAKELQKMTTSFELQLEVYYAFLNVRKTN